VAWLWALRSRRSCRAARSRPRCSGFSAGFCSSRAWQLLGSFNTAFQRKGTAVEPWKPTTAIVTTGPYRLTRNPAYLGMALVYIGIALLADALWVLVPLPVVLLIIDRMVIAREERYLERKFGQEYVDYKVRARRWI
jgi:protein-S-isoprenylcysteine O-methyltransferase Ste14